MKDFFNYESRPMSILGRIADLVIVNLLILLCSLPVFTIGTSLTAAHYAILKMHRDSENHVVRNFFRSFKENFLQTILLWFGYGLIFGLYISVLNTYGTMKILVVVTSVLVLVAVSTFVWALPLQARFHNTLVGVVKNAFLFAIRYIPLTCIMIGFLVVLAIFLYFMNQVTGYLLFTVGFSGYVYGNVLVYDKVFRELESK